MLATGIGAAVAGVLMTASPAYAGNGDAKAPNRDIIGSICYSALNNPAPFNFTGGATNDGSPGRWGIRSVARHTNGATVALEYLGQPPVVHLDIACDVPNEGPIQV